MNANNPALDPANLGSIAGAFRSIFTQMAMTTDGMLPARVIAFKPGAPDLVQVQPMIAIVGTDGSQLAKAQIADVPVLQIGGGGYIVHIPVKPGDLGWILACDKDISLYVQSVTGGTPSVTAPNTHRQKSFSDAVFIPDTMRGYTIAGEDTDNLVIQSNAGDVKISVGAGKIKISAPIVEIDSAATTITGDVTVQGLLDAQNGITSSGGGANNATITGNLRIIGDVTASGDITAHVP